MEYPNELVEAVKAVADAINGEGGGGTSENYVQTITGTLASPFGDYSPVSIGKAIYSGGLSGIIDIDASALGITSRIILPLAFIVHSENDGYYVNGASASANTFEVSQGAPISIINATNLIWRSSVDYELLGYMNNQYFNLPPTLPTTVTLYWHPMPEE